MDHRLLLGVGRRVVSRNVSGAGLRASATLAVLAVALTVVGCGRSGLRNFVNEVDTDGSVPINGGRDGATTDGGRDRGPDAPDAGRDTATDAGDVRDGRVDLPPGDGPVDASVDGKRVQQLLVSPASRTLAIGGTGMFSATLLFVDGTTSDVTATATWTTGSARIATVRAGRVTAVGTGTTSVTASTLGLSTAATVVVMPTISLVSLALDPPAATLVVGSSATFTVIGTFSDGHTADVSAMATWTTSSAMVAPVAAGKVSGLAAGTATITATIGMRSARATVTVTGATVASLSIAPALADTAVGGQVPFAAEATLSNGTHQDVTASVSWTSGTPAVATIDAHGLATGVASGKTTIGASFGGASASATLTVTGAQLIALEIEPVDPSAGVGVVLTFHLTGIFNDGSKVDLTATGGWQSSAPGVVGIDAGGRALTLAVGTSVISASNSGHSAQSTVTVTAASLRTIVVTPGSSILSVGGTQPLAATGVFSDSSMLDLTASVTWSAAPDGVVAVSNAPASAGTVTALANGTAIVTATLGTINGAAKVVVSSATLKSLAVSPASVSIPVGSTTPLTAQGTYSDGSVRDVTALVSWVSGDGTIAPVSSSVGSAGLVTGLAVGTTNVTATLDGQSGSSAIKVLAATLKSVTVTPANATTVAGLRSSYAALGTYSDGTMLDITTRALWSTGTATVATISNVAGAEGQLLARAAGTTTVSAVLDGVVGQTTVTVTGAAASSLSLSPIAISTPLGTAVQYTATLVLSNGTTRNVTGQVMWSSSARTVATIDGRGRAAPVAAGTTTITAVFMGLTASTTLTVTDAVISSIEVTPIEPTLPVGTVLQFTATAIFSDQTTRNVTGQATWVSSAPNVLGVNTARNRGQATGVSPGTARVTATFMGLSGNTTATVTDAVVVAISVSPSGITLPVGARRQYTAQAIRSDGTSMDVTARATWTSDAPMVAGVSSAGGGRGQVTAVGAGTANITATFMGLSGSTPVTVTQAMLTEIQVTPFDATLTVGTPLQYVATGLYSDGTSLPLTAMATWQSSNQAAAQVSNAGATRGRAMALGVGTTDISATFGGVTGSTSLTVTDATITQIQVTPFAPVLPVGFARQLTATAIFSDGTNRNITMLATWTSSAAEVAAVSDAALTKGLLTTGTAGTTTVKAQYLAQTGSTDVTVSAAKLTAIQLAPTDPSIAVGDTQAFTATGIFDDMSTLDVTPFVTWTSSDLDVADVSNADGSRGQASAFAAGHTVITAQRGMVTATASLTVK